MKGRTRESVEFQTAFIHASGAFVLSSFFFAIVTPSATDLCATKAESGRHAIYAKDATLL